MRKIISLAAVSLAAIAAPAQAAYIGGTAPCSVGHISPTAEACYGFYEGNVLSGNASDLLFQQEGLDMLGYTGPALTSANWSNIFDLTKIQTPTNGNEYTFSQALSGITYIGIHYGNGAGVFPRGTRGGGTAFYRFDAGTSIPNNLITTSLQGGSSAVLYATGAAGGIPEPTTWAMMILGFGVVGAAMRRKKARVSYSMA